MTAFATIDPINVPGGKRAAILAFLLAIHFVLAILGIAAAAAALSFGSGGVSTEDVEIADGLFLFVALGQILFYIIAGVVALMWLHRTYANTEGRDHSPATAVASVFIPFLNIVRPHTILQEMWRKSESRPQVTARNSPLILLWWLSFLAWQGFFFIALDESPDSGNLNQTLRALFLTAEIFAALSSALGFLMVVRLRRRQKTQSFARAAQPYAISVSPLTDPTA